MAQIASAPETGSSTNTTFLRHIPFVVWATLVYITTVLIVVLPTIYMYDPTTDEDFNNSTSTIGISSEIGKSVDDLIVFLLFCVPLAATVNAVFVYCFYYRHIRFMFYHLEQCQIENMLLSAATREMLSIKGPASSAFLLKSAAADTGNKVDGGDDNGNPLSDSPSVSTNTVKLHLGNNNNNKKAAANQNHKASPSKVIISSASNATIVPTYLNNSSSIDGAGRTISLFSFGHGAGGGGNNVTNNMSFDSSGKLIKMGSSSSRASPLRGGGSGALPSNGSVASSGQQQHDDVVSNASIFGQRIAETDDGGVGSNERTPMEGTLGSGGSVPNGVELASFDISHGDVRPTTIAMKTPSCLKKKQAKIDEQPSTSLSVTHECSILEKLKECNITPLQLYDVDGDAVGGGGRNEPVSHAGDDVASPLHSRMKRSATFYMSGGRAAGGGVGTTNALAAQGVSARGVVDAHTGDGSPIQVGPNAVFVKWATTATTDGTTEYKVAAEETSTTPSWKRETAHLVLCHPAHPVEVERFQRMSIITRSLHKKVRPELCRQFDIHGGQCLGGGAASPPSTAINMNDKPHNDSVVRPHRGCSNDVIPKARISHMYCCECFGAEEEENISNDCEGTKKSNSNTNSGWCGECFSRVETDGRSPGMKWLILDPQMARMLDESQATIERAFFLRRNIALQLNSLFAIKSVAELHHLNAVHFPPDTSSGAATGGGGVPSGMLMRGRSMRR